MKKTLLTLMASAACALAQDYDYDPYCPNPQAAFYQRLQAEQQAQLMQSQIQNQLYEQQRQLQQIQWEQQRQRSNRWLGNDF